VAAPEELRRRVRHDLRSPLAVVLGRAEMLLSGALGPITPAQRASLEAITRSAERLDRELGELAVLLDELDG
jgi:signal transduction histidine kinase